MTSFSWYGLASLLYFSEKRSSKCSEPKIFRIKRVLDVLCSSQRYTVSTVDGQEAKLSGMSLLFVHNARKRGKALLGSLLASLP